MADFSVYIGCAGWSLSSTPAGLFGHEGTHLERYAQVFNTVEINSSFYRPHQPKTYARWAAGVPDLFRFSIKVPRTITHQLRLHGAESATAAFMEQVSALGEKLGCLLVQLPPSLALNPTQAEHFFAMLHRVTSVPIACEPRHVSWFNATATALLNDAGVARVHAHPLPAKGAEPADDTGPLYIRLHGAPRIYYSSYDGAFISAIARKIKAACDAGRQAWCIFDNTAAGAAIPNALALMEHLSLKGRQDHLR